MKKASNVIEYAILVVVVGLLLGYAFFQIMIDGNGENRLRDVFAQTNQSGDEGLKVDVEPITD